MSWFWYVGSGIVFWIRRISEEGSKRDGSNCGAGLYNSA